MDMYLINALTEALSNALELGNTALAMQDAGQLVLLVAQSNKQLNTAEQVLSLHKRDLNGIERDLADARQKIQQLETSISNREGYILVEIASGVLAYRYNGKSVSRPGHRQSQAPQEYLCRHCMDCGLKSALQLHETDAALSYRCSICKEEYAANPAVSKRRFTGQTA
ncbi:MAG: hypothetical protein V4634_12650 [Pseudomonadota bacterium]